MSNTDKLRAFAEKYCTETTFKGFLVSDKNDLLSDLTALISENYYPKEFVEWLQGNTDHDGYVSKWYVYTLAAEGEICHLTLNEAFNYWKENEK